MPAAWVILAVLSATPDCEDSATRWREVGLEAPCVVLAKPTKAARVAAAMTAWALTREQAGCVADVLLAGPRLDGGDERRKPEGSAEQWRRCAQRWPGALAPWVGVIESGDDPVDVSALAGVDHGADLAWRLLGLRSSEEGLGRVILAQQPERLVDVLKHARVVGFPAFALALPIIDGAATRTPALTPLEWEALGRAALAIALSNGWLELTVDVWHRLPAATRAALKARPLPRAFVRLDRTGLHDVERGDLRSTLALALLAAGFAEEARAMPRSVATADDGRASGDLASMHALLDFHLARAKRASPAEALAAAAGLPSEAYALALPWVSPHEASLADRIEQSLDGDTAVDSVAVKARVDASHRRAMERLRLAWDRVEPQRKTRPDAGPALTK